MSHSLSLQSGKAGAWKASILRIFNDEMMSIRLVIDRYEIRAIEGALEPQF